MPALPDLVSEVPKLRRREHLRKFGEAAKLLLARLIYNDGLTTIFAMASIYVGAVLRMMADPSVVDPDSVAGSILRGWSARLFNARHPGLILERERLAGRGGAGR